MDGVTTLPPKLKPQGLRKARCCLTEQTYWKWKTLSIVPPCQKQPLYSNMHTELGHLYPTICLEPAYWFTCRISPMAIGCIHILFPRQSGMKLHLANNMLTVKISLSLLSVSVIYIFEKRVNKNSLPRKNMIWYCRTKVKGIIPDVAGMQLPKGTD